jgi:hypothetical protein
MPDLLRLGRNPHPQQQSADGRRCQIRVAADVLHSCVLRRREAAVRRAQSTSHLIQSTIEISIVTDNGTSLAGFVPLDLGGLLNRKDRREMFEIERCPDRSASLKMRLTFKAGSERIRNKVRVVHTENVEDSEPEDEAMMMRPITLARSVTPHS